MAKTTAVPSQTLEALLTTSPRSGCLKVTDCHDESVQWTVYFGGGCIHYATSTVGQQERLPYLWAMTVPTVDCLEFVNGTLEYETILNEWSSQNHSIRELRKILSRFTQEALEAVLALPKTQIEYLPQENISRLLIAAPWEQIYGHCVDGAKKRQEYISHISSPFARLSLSKKKRGEFYQYWQELKEHPETAQLFGQHDEHLTLATWVEMLSQNACLYDIAYRFKLVPDLLTEWLFPLIQKGIVEVQPFQEKRSNLRPLIACIDDSLTVQKQVKLTLEAVGYDVISITEPTSTLTALIRQSPALILMDINMPDIDGYELCRLLNQSSKLKDVPVVMLTGRDGVIDRLRAQLVGASRYITKPFTAENLIHVVNRIIQVEEPGATQPVVKVMTQ